VNGLVVAGHGHVVRSLEEGVEGETLHSMCILCVWLLHYIICVYVCVCGVRYIYLIYAHFVIKNIIFRNASS
jgi:hypothetical protein